MTATSLGTGTRKPDRVTIEWSVVVLALVVAAIVLVRPYDPALLAGLEAVCFGSLVVWIVVQDVKTLTIADGAVVSIAVLGLATRWSAGDATLAIGLDVVLTAGCLLAFREIYYRRKGVDGLGLGDVKLAAACGIFVGAQGFAWALLAASAIALVVVLGRRGLARFGRGAALAASDRIAFGAFLAPAFWAIWVCQQLAALPLDAGG